MKASDDFWKDITFTNDDSQKAVRKTVRLGDMIEFLNEKFREEDLTSFGRKEPFAILTTEPGYKYIKIVSTNTSWCYQRSVYCFLDRKGNILKAASWKAPAKHVRGTVFDPDYSWGKGLNRYGAAYL